MVLSERELIMRLRPILSALVASTLVLGGGALASAESYKVATEQKFVNVAFESRMEIEDVLGSTHSASGSITLDAKGGGSFQVAVPVATLRTGIDLRDEHLRSATWLDAKTFPNITFSGSTLVATKGDGYSVTGALTVHGVAKTRTVPVDVKKIPAATAAKLGLPAGNWLRIRATFTVKLSDHAIKIPSTTAAKVNDSWTVKVSLFAQETK